MSTSTSRRLKVGMDAGRHGWGVRPWEAVYRRAQAMPPPRVVHNTVHQTVVHLHQTNHQRIIKRMLLVTAPAQGVCIAAPGPGRALPEEDDPTRPAQAARRLARLLSTQSAQRVLRPFFRGILCALLREEGGWWQGRPHQSFLVLQGLLGWREERRAIVLRYAQGRRAGPEGLCRLPAPPVSQSSPARKGPSPAAQEEPARLSVPPAGRPQLSEGEFQALVRGVSAALDRRVRMETLRKGGW